MIGKLIHNTDVGGGAEKRVTLTAAMRRACALACARARRRCSPAAPARSRRAPTTIRGRRFNRKIFWFNDRLDVYVLEPVARGWDFVVPDAVQRSLSQLLRQPALPDRVREQHPAGQAARGGGRAIARFQINTFLGGLGFFDLADRLRPAAARRGHRPDASASGASRRARIWCCRSSAPRARATRSAWSATSRSASITYFIAVPGVTVGATAINIVNRAPRCSTRSSDAKEASLDYYTVRAQRLRAAALDADPRRARPPAARRKRTCTMRSSTKTISKKATNRSARLAAGRGARRLLGRARRRGAAAQQTPSQVVDGLASQVIADPAGHER